jgi:hypothetical protein
MKISKGQLKRIIKEEKQRLLTEAPGIIGGVGFHSQQSPKTNVPHRTYNNGYRKPRVAELHDPLDPYADSATIDKLDYAIDLIEKHQHQMPEASQELMLAIEALNELWEDLHPEI